MDINNNNNNNSKPFCGVFLSQRKCVGKSYVIQKMAKEVKHPLMHIPVMTKNVDYTFVVSKLNESYHHINYSLNDDNERKLFHIDVSFDARFDVNALLFKLWVLRHVSAENGESIHANRKHGFLGYIQYHKVFAHSIITAANHIACHMYEMPAIENPRRTAQIEEKVIQNEEVMKIFLVDFWSKADPPLAVLNQHGLQQCTIGDKDENENKDQKKNQENTDTHAHALSDLKKDLQAAKEHDARYGAEFSLLAKSINKVTM